MMKVPQRAALRSLHIRVPIHVGGLTNSNAEQVLAYLHLLTDGTSSGTAAAVVTFLLIM